MMQNTTNNSNKPIIRLGQGGYQRHIYQPGRVDWVTVSIGLAIIGTVLAFIWR